MKMAEFFDKVAADSTLCGESVMLNSTDEAVYVVRHQPTNLLTGLTVAEITGHDWSVVEALLTGRRNPLALQHMTRVVGYFSRVENWNASKILHKFA